MEEITTLEKEHVYLIHKQVINDFGGSIELYRDTDSKIESILSQQYPCFGYDKYKNVYEKATMLMYFFIKNHCFVDGNKRVGLQVAYVFLRLNDIELMLNNTEAEKIALDIAKSNYRNIEIDKYIKILALKIYNKSKDI